MKKTFALGFVSFLIIAATLSAHAEENKLPTISSKRLYEACRHAIEKIEEGPDAIADTQKIYLCLYYVTGAVDMAVMMSPSPIYGGQICAPRDFVFQDVARKVVALGVEHPTLFDEKTPASLLAYLAVKEKYGQAEQCPDAVVSPSD